MNPRNLPTPRDANEEISALIETLRRTEQRLEDLTAGEVDTVADRDGHTFLLRRAQEALRQTESARQSAILNTLPAHIALLDTQGNIVSVNESWRRFASSNGLHSPGCGIGLNYLAICDRARADCASEARQAAAGLRSVLDGTVKSFSLEYACHSPTQQRWFLLTATPLAESPVTGAVAMHLDITGRMRAREELLRFRAAMDATVDAILFVNRSSMRFVDVNATACSMFGYCREELLKMGPSQLGAGTPQQVARAHDAVIAGDGSNEPTETRLQRKDGTEVQVEVRWHAQRFGADWIVVAVVRDITGRKRTEDALRESDNRLSAVFHASPIAISVSRLADGKVLEVNDAALRLYGYAHDEVIGHTAAELGTYSNPRQRDEIVQRLRERGQVERYEIDSRDRNGAIGKLELTGRVIELQGEQCLVAMMLDVTERKRIEEMHLQAQKLESLGTLAGGIAHDFNNILSAIRGNADLAAKDLGPDHIAAESLEEIRKAGSRGSELVRRIMAFGRPREARQAVVDLSAVVGEVMKLLRSTLPAGISLSRDIAKDTPHVLADAGQIHDALVNLTTNAAYAIGARAGTIAYRLEPVQVGEELARSIPGMKQGRYARVTVSDSGCGMDAATCERIFDAFYTTKAMGEGTGLGLSMVHGTMRSHGGAVTVVSAPGKGSSFALYLPAASDKTVSDNTVKEDAGVAEQILPAAGQRVLFVDDEESLVFLASRMLSRLGHRISSFTDPREALEAFRAHPRDYDVIVTDLSMPHMSGLDLAREVLALRPGMPVLMTTGYIGAEDEVSARAAGIRELILKPATMDELAQALDRLFRDCGNRD